MYLELYSQQRIQKTQNSRRERNNNPVELFSFNIDCSIFGEIKPEFNTVILNYLAIIKVLAAVYTV